MGWKFSALLALGFSACSWAGTLDIAIRGAAPSYGIVIAKDAPAPYASAAKALSDFVNQQTGVRLAVQTDDGPLPASAVLIGPNAHSRKLLGAQYDAVLADVKDDGFLLKAAGRHVVVLGGRRGAQYGVYELLERYGGCRWYASWHSRIPRLEAFRIPDDLEDLQKPAFLMREPFWFDMFNTDQALRNKCNGNQMRLKEEHGGKVRFGAGMFVHTLGRLVPVDKYFDTHPEYFSEIDGVRTRSRTQLCLSNPDVLKIVTERVLAAIRRDPTATMYSVSQNDWYNPCQCAECKKIREQTGGTESGVMIWFVNQVAETVEKQFPNALIETLAYQYTREPPRKIRPRHNVVPRLCTIECDFSHPIRTSQYAQNKKFLKDIEGWAAMSDKLFIWDYVTDFSHYLLPYPNFASLQSNIQLFRDCHAVGVMSQGAYQGYHGDFAELKGWLGAKLLWNPDADVNALLDDFFNGYYGAAAPIVRRYFDELHARVKDSTFLSTFEGANTNLLTEEFLEHATGLWRQAEDAVKDDPAFLHNVRKGAMTAYYARLMRMNQTQAEYIWNADGTLTPAPKTKKQHDLAVEFMARFAPVDGRTPRCCEGKGNHDSRIAYFSSFQSNLETTTVASGGWSLTCAPSMGALAGALRDKDGINWLDGNAGGISSTCVPAGLKTANVCKLTAKDNASAAFSGAFGAVCQQDSRLSLAADGTVAATYTIRKKTTYPVDSLWNITTALNLGATGSVCYRLDDGPWQELALGENAWEADARLNLDAVKTITVAAPATGRAAMVTLAGGFGKSVFAHLRLMPAQGVARLVLREPLALNEAGIATRTIRLKAGLKAQGLPAARPLPPTQKPAAFMNTSSISFSKAGEWADYVSDMEAENGEAVKMYGTHYEWCLRAHTDFSLLAPNTTYRLRFHVKVEKETDAGEAFWAGIYDQTTKTFLGQCQPKIQDIKDTGYHWYTAKDLKLDATHVYWIWAGPGRFKGRHSAAKAVYVDRVELIPLD